jgi:Mrp family chromosome partitioning ATPase
MQHSLLGLPKEPGLTDVINKEITLLHAVQPTGIDNLSILTCGELRDRPASLLESPSMKSLLEEAAAHYDLIIIDTPSITSSADANALSQSSDGLVMIVRPNFTPKETLLQTVSELTGNGVPILGVVVNGMTNRFQKHYHDPVKDYQPVSKPLKYFTHLGNPVNNSARR